jgi:uncharacterized protein YdeI (YjbR/CyaY-like superfamily)
MMEQILFFNNRKKFRQWLSKNYLQNESIWIEFLKNKNEVFKPEEALEEALCYGWIDSLIKRVNDEKYIKKFSKRRNISKWSDYNKKKVADLIKSGLMTNIGVAAIENAKHNGQWDKKPAAIPENSIEILKEKLSSQADILEKFNYLNASSQRLFARFYFDAKKEDARERRLLKIIENIKTGKLLL